LVLVTSLFFLWAIAHMLERHSHQAIPEGAPEAPLSWTGGSSRRRPPDGIDWNWSAIKKKIARTAANQNNSTVQFPANQYCARERRAITCMGQFLSYMLAERSVHESAANSMGEAY
jgi:hypothetical protein